MFGVLFAFVLILICGICAILFSVLSWSQKNEIYFYIGAIFTGLVIIYSIYNIKYIYALLSNPRSAMEGLVILSFIVIPIIYLIKSKQKKKPVEDDVTDSYLDEIINSKDEEIDFE